MTKEEFIKKIREHLVEDYSFETWYDEYGGSSIEEFTAREAFIAGRITGLRFGYVFMDNNILEEIERLLNLWEGQADW
jgi:hypothetical protein